LKIYYDNIYSDGLDPEAHFPVDRYIKTYEAIKKTDQQSLIDWRSPRCAQVHELNLVHDELYVERFLNGELNKSEIRRIGLSPWKEEIVERTLRLTGGSLEALDAVLQGDLFAANCAGGTHHAFRDEGSGYCIFNDLAICAEVALRETNISRILILDLDVHQGDGTAAIFENDPRVFTVSLHGKHNFPFRKKQSDLDIEFEKGTEDDAYLAALQDVLDDLEKQAFDLIFFQAGVDALARDHLGSLALSRRGMRSRNQSVIQWRKKMDCPMLIFMGGGYSRPIEHTVNAFCDLFMDFAKEFWESKRSLT
jgi:acetoin utilization deacetylase AcuC-like enzyme